MRRPGAGASTPRCRRRAPRRSPFARLLFRTAFLVVAVGVLFAFGRETTRELLRLLGWVHAQGAWAPMILVAAYALGVVAFVPGAVMTAAAGVLFGVVQGTALVLIGATLCAASARGRLRRDAARSGGGRAARAPRAP